MAPAVVVQVGTVHLLLGNLLAAGPVQNLNYL
jgi:hypothetical protein